MYYAHAKLFLGWYLNKRSGQSLVKTEVTDITARKTSLKDLFPDKQRDGAVLAFHFIQYLRDTRNVSISYEANVIRGLTKLG